MYDNLIKELRENGATSLYGRGGFEVRVEKDLLNRAADAIETLLKRNEVVDD